MADEAMSSGPYVYRGYFVGWHQQKRAWYVFEPDTALERSMTPQRAAGPMATAEALEQATRRNAEGVAEGTIGSERAATADAANREFVQQQEETAALHWAFARVDSLVGALSDDYLRFGEPQRSFLIAREASWYREGILPAGVVDEVTVSIEGLAGRPSGGKGKAAARRVRRGERPGQGQITLSWERLAGASAPVLKVTIFEDGWRALVHCPDVLAFLASLDAKRGVRRNASRASVARIVEGLEALRFADRTPRDEGDRRIQSGAAADDPRG